MGHGLVEYLPRMLHEPVPHFYSYEATFHHTVRESRIGPVVAGIMLWCLLLWIWPQSPRHVQPYKPSTLHDLGLNYKSKQSNSSFSPVDDALTWSHTGSARRQDSAQNPSQAAAATTPAQFITFTITLRSAAPAARLLDPASRGLLAAAIARACGVDASGTYGPSHRARGSPRNKTESPTSHTGASHAPLSPAPCVPPFTAGMAALPQPGLLPLADSPLHTPKSGMRCSRGRGTCVQQGMCVLADSPTHTLPPSAPSLPEPSPPAPAPLPAPSRLRARGPARRPPGPARRGCPRRRRRRCAVPAPRAAARRRRAGRRRLPCSPPCAARSRCGARASARCVCARARAA
jgi:hypothetical protein